MNAQTLGRSNQVGCAPEAVLMADRNDYYSTHKDATAGVALAAALLRAGLGSHDGSKARH